MFAEIYMVIKSAECCADKDAKINYQKKVCDFKFRFFPFLNVFRSHSFFVSLF